MSQQMLPDGLSSLFTPFAPVFTTPSFRYFCQWVLTMMLVEGRKCATTVWAHGPRDRHFTNYSRLLSRYRWSCQKLAQTLVAVLWQAVPRPRRGQQRLYLALDDTLVAKSGRRQDGVGLHLQPNAQRKSHFVKGHCWVVLGMLSWLGERALCFPLTAAVYVRKKDCLQGQVFRDKIELGLRLLQGLRWPAQPALTVIADGAWAVHRFVAGVRAQGHHVITRLRHNARVHLPLAPPVAKNRGRPRKYGRRVHLASWVQDPSHGQHIALRLYGQSVSLWLGSLDAVPRVLGALARIVVVRIPRQPLVVLMCTDLSLSPEQIVLRYASRFSIEIAFRELKQRFGFGDYQARSREAILRHVHLSFIACSLLQTILVGLLLCRAKALSSLLCQPWRDPAHPLTLGQTRLLLQQLTLLEGIFSTSAPQRSYQKIILQRLRRVFARMKCAEL